MEIDNIEIKIQKYDRFKQQVIVNLFFFHELEVRGYVARFTTTKYSPDYPVWIVSPPSVRQRNKKYFHVVRLENRELWKILQEKIVSAVKEYTERENTL